MRHTIETYYRLVKPGIIYGNILTASGGFLLASQRQVDWLLFAALLIGTSLLIAAACVCNNYMDRDIDALMVRTKRRALVNGAVSSRSALTYATILVCLGLTLLITATNTLVVLIGIAGFLAYVFLYGYSKRRTVHGTLIGTISGATPIVAGYTAATGRLDMGALVLFLIMVFWQMPHFYAIAMYRRSDYVAAHIPVLPVVRGMWVTKLHTLAYTAAFVVAVASLSTFGYAGYSYLIVMLGLGGYWLWRGVQGLHIADDTAWARSMFGLSLTTVLALSVMLALDPWLV